MQKTILGVALAAAVALPAAAQQLKPEDQIHLRQSTMALIGYNFGSLAAMAEGKKPFDREEAQRNADMLPMLAALPGRFFGEGTDKGGNTKAKPGIWAHEADFEQKLRKMQEEVAKLPAVARAGDNDAFRKQVSAVAHDCKACHDDYRAK